MVQAKLAGLKSAQSLPTSVTISQDAQNDVNRILALVPDAALVSEALTKYLIAHGENAEDDSKTVSFDIGKYLHANLSPRNSETEAALRLAIQQARLAVVSADDAEAAQQHEEASLLPKISSDDSTLSLFVHPCGSIRRAVATGFAVRLLVALKPSVADAVALSRLQPQVPLGNTFYVGDNAHYTVDEAVKAASKRLHVSVTNLPDSEFFDIAEGVVLYNPSHYWSLLTTCEVPLRLDEDVPPADGTDADGKPVRLMALWRSRWFVALELVRRLLYARDYGAFFANSPFLVLSGRFSMEVPEFPLLKPDDRQGNVFESILNRVDRVTVQKFGAFLQRAVAKGSIEYAVRQAKVAGVIRAIGEAIGSIRTPIKTVDLCLQALTIIAQNVRCHRPQSLCFHELFPSGFAGDLMEHGFITASGRSDDSLGVSIPSLVTKNFLHRRDAWAVLSHLHPTFVHINERLVLEACRRALPQYFQPQDNANAKQHNAGQTDESSPTHYRSSDDLFMIASAMVILSHATTNANARRSQLTNLRPCVGQLIAGTLETLRCGHTKIPGWVAQQTRLALASIRIAKAVVEDWIAETKEHAAPTNNNTSTSDEALSSKPEVAIVSPIYKSLIADLCRLISGAPLVSSLMATTLQLVDVLVQESFTNAAVRSALASQSDGSDASPAAAPQSSFALIVDALRQRFVDAGFDADNESATYIELTIKDSVVKRVLAILLAVCLKTGNQGNAGSVAVTLGVHHSADWGLELVEMINSGGVSSPSSLLDELDIQAPGRRSAPLPTTTLPAPAAPANHDVVQSSEWKQLATASHAVFIELFNRCDVTSVASAANALSHLLKVEPSLHASFEDVFPVAISWLRKPIYELLEEEERRLESELGEEGKGLINTSKNTILCAFLEIVKVLVACQRVAVHDETVPGLCTLVQQFRQDVPYLNHVLQALLTAVTSGGRRSAFHPHRALLRSIADASKTSGKLSTKLFTILDDKDFKKQKQAKELAAKEGDAEATPQTDSAERASVSPAVSLGIAVLARKSGAKDNSRAPVRSLQSRAKDAQRRDEAGRKQRAAAEQAEERQSNNYNRSSPSFADPQQQRLSSHARQGDDQLSSNTAKETQKPSTKKMVSMKGDDGGINLDLLTLRIAQRQKSTEPSNEPQRATRPTTWANVAKSAKTAEEREEEALREEAAELERVQNVAAERAARRKVAYEEEKRAQQDNERRYRLEEEVKRNRGAVDVVDDYNTRSSPAAVDVHALLNMVLTAPGSVIRKAPVEHGRHAAPAISRLAAVDDDEVGLGTVPTLGANAAIASLAQLRLGSEGSTVVHRAAYTSASAPILPPPQQQQSQQHQPPSSNLTALLQPPGYHQPQAQPQPQQQQHQYPQQHQQSQQQQVQPTERESMPSYFTTSTMGPSREAGNSIWNAEAPPITGSYTSGPHHAASRQQTAPHQQALNPFPPAANQHRGEEEWGVQSALPPGTSTRRSPPPQGNPWAHVPQHQPPHHQHHHHQHHHPHVQHATGSQLPFPGSYPQSGNGYSQYTNPATPPAGGSAPPVFPHPLHNQPPQTSLFSAPPTAPHGAQLPAPSLSHMQQQHPQQRVWLPGMNNNSNPIRDVRVGGAAVAPPPGPYGAGNPMPPAAAPFQQQPPSISIGFPPPSQQRPPLQTTVTIGGRQTSWPLAQPPVPTFQQQQVPSITVGGRAPSQQPALPLPQPGASAVPPPLSNNVRVGHYNGSNSAPSSSAAQNPYATASTPGGFGY